MSIDDRPSAKHEPSTVGESQLSVEDRRAALNNEEPEDEETLIEEMVTPAKQETATDFEFNSSLIKTEIEELILLIISLRKSQSHGKQVLDYLSTEFDTDLSPGTVYPLLHDFEDERILAKQELVQTKKYSVADHEEAERRIAIGARQNFALGMVFKMALETIEWDD